MIRYILYITISILIIWVGHYIIFSHKSDAGPTPRIINIKKEGKVREEILNHLRDDEREREELEDYLKKQMEKELKTTPQ